MLTQRERTQNDAKECIEMARKLRTFVRGKPQHIRDAAHNIIAGFRSVAAGRAGPHTYRMLGENVERLGGK